MKNLITLITLASFLGAPIARADGGGMMVPGTLDGKMQKQGSPLDRLKLTESPFEACKDKVFISNSVYEEDKEYWSQAIKECGNELNMEVVPDSGFFSMFVDKFSDNKDEKKAMEFLKKVQGEVSKDIAGNISTIQAQIACMENPKAAGCEKILGSLDKNIKSIAPSLRKELALSSYSDRTRAFEKPNIEENINTNLIAPTKHLAVDARMEALDADEINDAKKVFAAESEEIEKAWDEKAAKGGKFEGKAITKGDYKNGMFEKFRVEQRSKKFDAHRAEYMKKLYSAPILGFLGSKDAVGNCLGGKNEACAEAKAAAKALLANNEKQLALVNNMISTKVATHGGKSSATVEKKVSDLLDLMGYVPQVNRVLKSSPDYCQSATGVTNLVSNRSTKHTTGMIAAAIPLFMAGGAVGGAAANSLASAYGVTAGAGMAAAVTAGNVLGMAAAGSAIGAYSYHEASANLNDQKEKFFNRATEEDGAAMTEIKNLQDAQTALAWDVILQPLNILVPGAGATVGLATTKMGAKIAASSSLRKALAEKGLAKETIQSLTTRLASKDAEVARAAGKEIMRELGWTEEGVKLVDAARKKGLISQFTHKDAINALGAEVKDSKLAARALKYLEEIDPSKAAAVVNDGNREAKWEALVEGIRSNADPKKTAEVYAKWDEGAEGLTATFKAAREIRAKNPGMSFEEAFAGPKGALDEKLTASSAEYRAATPEGKAAQRKQLCECPGVCKL